MALAAIAALDLSAMSHSDSSNWALFQSWLPGVGRNPTAAQTSPVGWDKRAVGERGRTTTHPASSARLEFSTSALDLGDGKPNEIVRGELTLTNCGLEPAKYSLIKHCGCTELSPMSGELAPGASQTIRVGVRLPDHANSEKNTSAEVRAGESPDILGRCSLSARCPAPFHVEPAFISFGSLTVEELGNASAEIRISPVDGRPRLDGDSLLVDHDNQCFQVDHAAPSPRGSLTLRVGIKANLPPGHQWDALEIRLAGSEHVMRVPVNAAIVEPISVVPRTVMMRRDADGKSFRTIELLVMARAGRQLRGAVTLAEGPACIVVEDLGDVGLGRRRIRLSVRGDAEDLPRESSLWLRSAGANDRFGLKLINPSA